MHPRLGKLNCLYKQEVNSSWPGFGKTILAAGTKRDQPDQPRENYRPKAPYPLQQKYAILNKSLNPRVLAAGR
uniref:Uncharacterized protein n=1 Tax=Pyricularia oryzae (strain P131) TaxID=1143193 RepID=L7J2B6_PYRO1